MKYEFKKSLFYSPINAEKNSGAELPAAMNVAPATSGDRFKSGQEKESNMKLSIFQYAN